MVNPGGLVKAIEEEEELGWLMLVGMEEKDGGALVEKDEIFVMFLY